MCRATSMATNLAVAVAATAVGCMLVISLTPSRPDTGRSRPSAGGPTAAVSGHAGSAARAATSALNTTAAGTGPERPGEPGEPGEPEDFAAPPTGRIEVTAPKPGVDYKANGSFTAAWKNSTGEEVDVWLRAATGHGRSQRVALVVPRAEAGPTGEAIVTLPKVPPGPRYVLEVATAGDGAIGAVSRTFAITE